MSTLENPKTYTGSDLETIFFRPMLTGSSAQELGIRVLYNMPVPTTVQLWDGQKDILQKYTTAGWTGGASATKFQKTISLNKVKAELGFSAADYFSKVYELISNRADVNMDDLTGSELEQAETALFKESITEGIRATMWVGNTTSTTGFNTFNGFLKSIVELALGDAIYNKIYHAADVAQPAGVLTIFEDLWLNAAPRLQDLKGEGQLALFVTSDLYHLYEKYLDNMGVESSYVDTINGRPTLAYHGIPVIDLHISSYLQASTTLHKSFCFLTDRRNLVMAVNTSDFPGTEIRMWYNPDLMENRQRAVFMAGCEVIDESLLNYAYKA